MLQVEHISSTANAYIKHCVRLRTSAKYRAEAGRFLLAGRELLGEAAGEAHSRDKLGFPRYQAHEAPRVR